MTPNANVLTSRATPDEPPRAAPAAASAPPLSSLQLRAFVDALERLGYDVTSLLTDAGIRRAELDDPDAMIPSRMCDAILGRACEQRRHPNLGAHLAAVTPIGTYPLLDYLVVTADTVEGALDQLVRYFHLVNAPFRLGLANDGDMYGWSSTPPIRSRRNTRRPSSSITWGRRPSVVCDRSASTSNTSRRIVRTSSDCWGATFARRLRGRASSSRSSRFGCHCGVAIPRFGLFSKDTPRASRRDHRPATIVRLSREFAVPWRHVSRAESRRSSSSRVSWRSRRGRCSDVSRRKACRISSSSTSCDVRQPNCYSATRRSRLARSATC
jgi:hypothetical protein